MFSSNTNAVYPKTFAMILKKFFVFLVCLLIIPNCYIVAKTIRGEPRLPIAIPALVKVPCKQGYISLRGRCFPTLRVFLG
ncbi:hypothetical protein QE152_g1297 [Popillia japonica]|uniref:Uncharacterized protein n=1 Tax=Popillia japonica TaxID=7064 RepID=A0AAW1N890_POPJA